MYIVEGNWNIQRSRDVETMCICLSDIMGGSSSKKGTNDPPPSDNKVEQLEPERTTPTNNRTSQHDDNIVEILGNGDATHIQERENIENTNKIVMKGEKNNVDGAMRLVKPDNQSNRSFVAMSQEEQEVNILTEFDTEMDR